MVVGVHHIEINVANLEASYNFYSLLSAFFEGSTIVSDGESFSWRLGPFYLYCNQVKPRFEGAIYHRKQVGLDHIAIELSEQEEVLSLNAFLNLNNVPILYNADYYGPGYFAIFLEDPDRFKLEFGVNVP